jgi:hypothetical protein
VRYIAGGNTSVRIYRPTTVITLRDSVDTVQTQFTGAGPTASRLEFVNCEISGDPGDFILGSCTFTNMSLYMWNTLVRDDNNNADWHFKDTMLMGGSSFSHGTGEFHTSKQFENSGAQEPLMLPGVAFKGLDLIDFRGSLSGVKGAVVGYNTLLFNMYDGCTANLNCVYWHGPVSATNSYVKHTQDPAFSGPGLQVGKIYSTQGDQNGLSLSSCRADLDYLSIDGFVNGVYASAGTVVIAGNNAGMTNLTGVNNAGGGAGVVLVSGSMFFDRSGGSDITGDGTDITVGGTAKTWAEVLAGVQAILGCVAGVGDVI